MVRLAVLSDTHWKSWDSSESSAHQIDTLLSQGAFDGVWHAGDVVDESILRHLEQFAPVTVVKGNCDRWFERVLPHRVVEKIEQVKVGMIHGWDIPLDHLPTVVRSFPEDVDIIIHGHTHRRREQSFERPDGSRVTVINPGSVSSPRGGETAGLGELRIDGEQWEYRALHLS